MTPAIFNRSLNRPTNCWTRCLIASLVLLRLSALASDPKPNRLSPTELSALEAQLTESPNNTDLLFKLGDAYYRLGADGDKDAVKKATEALERLLKIDPEHSRALVTLGSVFTLKARDALLPTGKLKWARKGIDTMDRAVAMAPDSFEVRWVRASNNFHMPKFMNRQEVALADLRWLWTQCQQESADSPDLSVRQKVGLFLGTALERDGDADQARKVWRAALEWAPTSPEGTEIRSRLNAEK